MGIEAATFINDLVTTNPEGTDIKGQGDDHIRLIKAVLKNSFPSITAAQTFGGWQAKVDALLEKSADYAQLTTDDGKLVVFDTAGAQRTYTLLAAATVGDGFVVWVLNTGQGLNNLVVDASGAETISKQTTITLADHQGGMLYCDGGEWYFVGSALSLPTGQRTIRRTVNDSSNQTGLTLRRQRGLTPAAGQNGDNGTKVGFTIFDNAGAPVEVTMADIKPRMIDATAGSVDAILTFGTIVAGVIDERIVIGQGEYSKNAVGGDKGLESTNFSHYYLNGIRTKSPELLTKTATYAVVVADMGKTIRWTTAVASATLPTAVGLTGAELTLWNDAATGDVTVDPDAAETLDTFATRFLRPGDRVTIISDGTNWQTIRGRYSFKTAELAVDNAHADEVAHGIGEIPNRWRLILRNKTGEHNYVANDELVVGGDYADQGAAAAGVGVALNTTNIYLLQATIQYRVLDRTTPGLSQAITAGNWKFELEVWKEYVG